MVQSEITPTGELLSVMENERKRWAQGTLAYGIVYRGLRIVLIIMSATVAAQANLEDSVLTGIIHWIPIFALAVAILTALDTWMKPRDKWRGFMSDRDGLDRFILELKSIRDPQEDQILAMNERFSDLRQRHREQNVI